MSGLREVREEEADQSREALLRTLTELDRRRHVALDLRAGLGEHRRQLVRFAALFGMGFLVLGALRYTWRRARLRRALQGPELDWRRTWAPPPLLVESRRPRHRRVPLLLGTWRAASVVVPLALRVIRARSAVSTGPS